MYYQLAARLLVTACCDLQSCEIHDFSLRAEFCHPLRDDSAMCFSAIVPDNAGALAHLMYLPTRGLSARILTMAADRRPGAWARAAGPVRALLARRI